MSRTAGVQDREAGLRTRIIFWLLKRYLRRVPVASRIRARDPKLLELAFKMDIHMARRGTIAPKLKELAQLKVAAMVGCPF
jgi:hypothetical protein